MEHTIKKYRLTSVGNNLELGKRGGMVKFDLNQLRFKLFCPDKITLSELEIADATNEGSAVTLRQLAMSSMTSTPLVPVSASVTMEPNRRYYNTVDSTLTLPDITNVNIGDEIYIRSSSNISMTTVAVFDSNDSIVTNAGSMSQFSIDLMGEFTFVYSGSSTWEVL